MKTSLFLSVSAMCLMPVALHASSILSENFDELTPTGSATSAGAFNAIGGTNVDIVGGNFFGSLCRGPESGNCVDMGGSNGNALGNLELATSLNLTAGLYNLSFDLIGSGRNQASSTTVTFGSYSQTFLLASGDLSSGIVNTSVWIAGGPTQLEFMNNGVPGGNQNIGALLDNVNVSAVPEPGSVGLMLTGVLGAAGAIRRRLMA